MTEFTIARAAEFDGKEVELRGWLYNKRASGKLIFPIFRDGTGLMQAVVSKAEVSPEVWERAGSLTQETSLIARGTVRADKRAPGGYELVLRDLEIVQVVPVDDPYPISPKDHGVDFLLSHRHLWVRSARQAALLRLRHEVMRSAREYLDSQGFVETSAPILTPAACEGTTTLFALDYFDLGQAFLTQSGQLYVEGTAAALGKVYCFGPTFRAEVLDAGAGGGLRGTRRPHGTRREPRHRHRADGAGTPSGRLGDTGPGRQQAGEDQAAFRSPELRPGAGAAAPER
jgi:asparaginyl-tRNA synthetase